MNVVCLVFWYELPTSLLRLFTQTWVSLYNHHTVVEPKFVCLTCSEAKQTKMSEFEAEKGLLQGPCKKNRQLMLKKPKLLDGFRGRVLIGKICGEGCKACDLPLIGWW